MHRQRSITVALTLILLSVVAMPFTSIVQGADTDSVTLTLDSLPSDIYLPVATVSGSTNGDTILVNYARYPLTSGRFSVPVYTIVEGKNSVTIEARKGTETISRTYTFVYHRKVVCTLVIGRKTMTVHDSDARTDKTAVLDAAPVIKNGRTLVPIRPIVEAIRGMVVWDATARKVSITVFHPGTMIDLWIGESMALIDQKGVQIDTADPAVVPEIIDGRTMLPLRFIAESTQCTVDWTAASRTITITHQL